MKRTISWAMVSLVILLAGCTIRAPQQTSDTAPIPGTGTPAATATPQPSANADLKALQSLLPNQTAFQWHYFGTAEYAHSMQLISMEDTADGALYHTEGTVADLSGGASEEDYAIRIDYRITPQALTQQAEGSMLMDSIFPTLELIRGPLVKGTAWTQQQNDAEGRSRQLRCTITDVTQKDERKVYHVEYRVQDSDYYEERELSEGIGVTYFEKYLPLNNIGDKFSYQLFTEETRPIVMGYEKWLPQLGLEYRYTGLAEYAHTGQLIKLESRSGEDVYEYRGTLLGASGVDTAFVVQYRADTKRGTVTEKVVSNERGTKDIHSKLHNLVVLKFPLEAGATWSHKATLDGASVTVKAEVVRYDADAGLVQVRYTAPAEGYYDGTYREERTFEAGYGMTDFSMLLPGDIGLSAEDAKDEAKRDAALDAYSFHYAMEKPAE